MGFVMLFCKRSIAKTGGTRRMSGGQCCTTGMGSVKVGIQVSAMMMSFLLKMPGNVNTK